MAYKNKEDSLAYYRKYNATRRGTKKQKQRWNRAYYEKHKERARIYYEDNKEDILAEKAVRYEKERDHLRTIARKSYHKRKGSDTHKAYLERSKEKRKKWRSEWLKTPVGKRNSAVGHARRAALKKNAEGTFTAEDIKDMYAGQLARCYYCSISIEEKYHIDYMTPISREGSNWVDNLCLTCPECNMTKHTQTAEEFIEQKGFMYGI